MHLKDFEKRYVEAIQEGYAAVFAGAGLSVPTGFINWKELLKDIAETIGLDVSKEHDLIEVAQFYQNERGGRHAINQLILRSFYPKSTTNQSIDLLTSMPIDTYWTTNYDSLIEDHLNKYNKRVDIKIASEHLANTLEGRDAVVYKMHGDYRSPDKCILTKDDYEAYNQTHQLFSMALQGDLISKTFLFIGFSFDDPNLRYILSRIRSLLGNNQREHYYLFKKYQITETDSNEVVQYAQNKQRLFVNDLKRYGIQAVLIESYSEIPDILNKVKRKFKNKKIFISGSAIEYSDVWENKAHYLLKRLTEELYRNQYHIITGNARGFGSYIISCILKATDGNLTKMTRSLSIRSFPYEEKGSSEYEQMVKKYRESIAKESGITIVLFGNKLIDGEVTIAQGVLQEFELAKEAGNFIIPVGSTGYAAKIVFDEVKQSIDTYPYLKEYLEPLENETRVDVIIEIIKKILQRIQSL